jgi:hypothetical protein
MNTLLAVSEQTSLSVRNSGDGADTYTDYYVDINNNITFWGNDGDGAKQYFIDNTPMEDLITWYCK